MSGLISIRNVIDHLLKYESIPETRPRLTVFLEYDGKVIYDRLILPSLSYAPEALRQSQKSIERKIKEINDEQFEGASKEE